MKKSLLAVLALAATTQVWADVIDQDAPTNNAYMAAFSQGDLAQSFQQSASNITGAGIFLQAGIGSTDLVTISLYDKLPNAGGNLLAQASAKGTQGTYCDVFWSQVNISANTTYYLVFTGNQTLGIAGDVTNQYKRGQVYANSGFQSFPDFDYTFRTYAAVPEPASIVALGLGAAVLIRRRKKA